MRKSLIILKQIGIVALLVFVFQLRLTAQSASDLRFNEILVINDSLNVDDFGQHGSWIEIFNTAYNTVDIGGCYLTDDLDNPTKYWIPTGDPLTRIPSRCYILFWADAKPYRGIFHLNFDLEDAPYVALFDASGRNLIHQVEINRPQIPNKSFGLISAETNQWGTLDKITPASSNDHTRRESAGQKFVEMDPTGLGMTITAMAVVFTALALLYFVYKLIGKMFVSGFKKVAKPVAGKSEEKIVSADISGEENAAIAMALYMYQTQLHDLENTVLTIKKVSRVYSPWSSKIYTLRKNPR